MAKSDKEQTPKAKPSKETTRVQNPHDSFFRRLFSKKEHARQLIDGFLAKELLALMRIEEITYQPGVSTSENLENFFTDLIFQVPLRPAKDDVKPEPAAIYLLFDHKSYADWTVAEQLLRYMNERWEVDRQNKMQPRVVIPIVFYHGEKGWHVPQQFEKIFKNVDPILHKFIPKFEYILINIDNYSDSDIESRIRSKALQSGLLLLKYIFDGVLPERLEYILALLANEKLPKEELMPLLEAELRYLTGVKNRLPDEVIDQTVRKVFAEEAEIMDTIFERMMERGRQEGLQKLQEAEKAFQQEREAERQEIRFKSRKSILSILNHILALSEADQKTISIELAEINDIDALYRLSDAALESSSKGFIYFTRQLALEQNSDESKLSVEQTH